MKDRETGMGKIPYIFYEVWPSKLTYLFTEGRFFLHYEIAATKIGVKRFPLIPV